MNTPRDRRLQADFQKVQALVASSGGTLRLSKTTGTPPTTYVIEYRCPGLEKVRGKEPQIRSQHSVEINLSSTYPMSQPTARMLTPAFNPHIFSNLSICLGGRWTATETLDTLILRIGALLQLDPRVIDFTSLANGEAGTWLVRHKDWMPLPGTVTFKAPKEAHG